VKIGGENGRKEKEKRGKKEKWVKIGLSKLILRQNGRRK
jgi:hypothetical protein